MNALKRRAPRTDWRNQPGELTDAGHWVATHHGKFIAMVTDAIEQKTLDDEYRKIQRGEAH